MISTAYNEVAVFKNNSSVHESIFYDTNDFEGNKKSSLVAAKNIENLAIKIRPHVDPGILIGFPNPELQIKNLIGDCIQPTKGLDRLFADKKKQFKDFKIAYEKYFPNNNSKLNLEKSFILIDISLIKHKPFIYAKKIVGQLTSDANNNAFLIIRYNENAVLIDRKMAKKGIDFAGKLLEKNYK